MRWWGWGEDAHAGQLPEPALGLLRDELGVDGAVHGPVALEDVVLGASTIGDPALDRLKAFGEVHEDPHSRVVHAAGKGYVDLVRLRLGRPEGAPDAVVVPRDVAGVAGILEVCAAERIAVVPFGGGTSVVGGLTPVRDGFAAVISLDLARLDRVVRIDERSLTATVQAGPPGPPFQAGPGAPRGTPRDHPPRFPHLAIGRRRP